MAETREQRDAFIRRVIEEADAEIRAQQPEPEPHYLRPVQAPLFAASGVDVPLKEQL